LAHICIENVGHDTCCDHVARPKLMTLLVQMVGKPGKHTEWSAIHVSRVALPYDFAISR
jgi:hypothetical protein